MADWDRLSVDSIPASHMSNRVNLGRTAGNFYRAEEFRPVLVLGPQRSGKTSGFAIPAILEWDGPALVTSVRSDILGDSFSWRQQLGRVSIFDPSGSLKGTHFAKYRRTWNPLQHCNDWDGCVKVARALTEAGKTSAHDLDFWNNLASQFLAPLLFAAALEGYAFLQVVEWLKNTDDDAQRDAVWPILERSGNRNAMGSYKKSFEMEYRTKNSVHTTLWSALRVYDYESVAGDSAPEFDIASFLESPTDTIYVCAPPDDQEEYRAQFTAFVRMILREAYQKNYSAADESAGWARAGRIGQSSTVCPLLVLLDEAGNIAALENLGTLATTAAGTSIQLVCVFHDISQIQRIYGQFEARSIVNNHSALVVLPGCRDSVTLTELELLLRGERVANTREGQLNSRHVRSMARGTCLVVYENLRPIVLSLRSRFTDDLISSRVTPPEVEDLIDLGFDDDSDLNW